jgi:hypothetical protein
VPETIDHLESSFPSSGFMNVIDHSITEQLTGDGVDRHILQSMASPAITDTVHPRARNRYRCRNHILTIFDVNRDTGTRVETEEGYTAYTAPTNRIEE